MTKFLSLLSYLITVEIWWKFRGVGEKILSKREHCTITANPCFEFQFRKHLKHQLGLGWSCFYQNPKEGSAPPHSLVHYSQLISLGTFIKWTDCFPQPFLSVAEFWQKPHSQKYLTLDKTWKDSTTSFYIKGEDAAIFLVCAAESLLVSWTVNREKPQPSHSQEWAAIPKTRVNS